MLFKEIGNDEKIRKIKIFYCPVCGDVNSESPNAIGGYYRNTESCCRCHKTKYKSIKENYFDLYEPDEEYDFLHNPNERIKNLIREKYVLIDSNKEFNKRKYRARERFEEKVAAGYYPTKTQPSSQTNKSASVVGRAVVGGAIAGPAGAVVGAISAVDKNIQNKK